MYWAWGGRKDASVIGMTRDDMKVVRHKNTWEKNIPGREDSKSKGPEAEVRNRGKAGTLNGSQEETDGGWGIG